MRAEEIRELTDAEIRQKVAELKEERFRLQFRAATEHLDDPLRFRVIRKDIARLLTVLQQRAQGAAGPDAARSQGA